MTARATRVRATNTTYWGEGRHPCGGTGKAGRGQPGRGGKAEMSSGPPENGAFVWGTDEGQGVIVWEGRKCHTDWHCHSEHRIDSPAPALRTPCASRDP